MLSKIESIDLGKEVLDALNSSMQLYWTKTYTYDQYSRANNYKDTSIFLEGVGDQYDISGVFSWTMRSLMKDLAYKSQGKIPSLSTIQQTFRDQAVKTFSIAELQANTSNGLVYTALGAVDSGINGAQYLGDRLIGTGKNAADAVENTAKALAWFLPLVVIGGLGFYVYLNAKNAPRLKK